MDTTRHKNAREPLGHSESLGQIRMHPDLVTHLRERAKADYCSVPEYVRRLVIADMRRGGGSDG